MLWTQKSMSLQMLLPGRQNTRPTIDQVHCADNGWIVCHRTLQISLDLTTDLFACVGMKVNTNKTKAMVGHNGSLGMQLSALACKCCSPGEGLMDRESKRQKISCLH